MLNFNHLTKENFRSQARNMTASENQEMATSFPLVHCSGWGTVLGTSYAKTGQTLPWFMALIGKANSQFFVKNTSYDISNHISEIYWRTAFILGFSSKKHKVLSWEIKDILLPTLTRTVVSVTTQAYNFSSAHKVGYIPPDR